MVDKGSSLVCVWCRDYGSNGEEVVLVYGRGGYQMPVQCMRMEGVL